MKLERILDQLGALEKNAFIKIIDTLIANKPKNIKQIEQILANSDGGIKSVDNANISQIFSLLADEFSQIVYQEFQKTSSQLDIVIDLIIQDGNSILKQDWFSRLYEQEIKNIKSNVKALKNELDNEKSEISAERKRDYKIYLACLQTAYRNDLKNNSDSKITSDEQTILNTLSSELELSQDEVKLMNYMIVEPKLIEIQQIVDLLKNIGAIFFTKKTNTIYVADEVVKVLRTVRQKEVADKFFRRVLRLLKEPQINMICKKHNVNRKLSTSEKIESIISNGISFQKILTDDIYKDGTSLLDKKRYLNEFCDKHLGISPALKGTTIEEKISNLIAHFDAIEKDEKVGISHDGYEKLLTDLQNFDKQIEKSLREMLNQSPTTELMNTEFMLDRNLKPTDILELIQENTLLDFCTQQNIKTRGEIINNILSAYTDSENIYIENYENIASRNLNSLKNSGIHLKEPDLGILFEDVTKSILRKLGFNVNDELKKKLNTSKDKMDILIQLDNNDLIIIECKSHKESGFNKFSSVSRQIKSYKEGVEKNGFRVIKTILVAPEFSDAFITDCDESLITSELHLSLLTAKSLLNIFEGFKNQNKYEMFPHQLFLRDLIIDDNRIIKAISK